MADEKKKFWLKIEKDFLKSSQIKVIKNLPNGKDYIIFYLAIMLESTETIGHLRFSELIPYNEEMLAAVTDTNIDIVRCAMKAFTALGLVQILDNGTIFLPDVPKRTGKESESTERVRRFRKTTTQKNLLSAQKMPVLQCNGNVTKCNADETECNSDVTKCNDNKEKRREEKRTVKNSKEQNSKEETEKIQALFFSSLIFDEPLNLSFSEYEQLAKKYNASPWLTKNIKHISKIHKFQERIVTGYYDKFERQQAEQLDYGEQILKTWERYKDDND